MKSRQEERSAVERSLLTVVDDDESVRESLPDLLGEFGFAARAFSSAEEFLASPVSNGTDMPIIFITGHGDVPKTVRAMKAGVVKFLTKPFDDQALLSAIRQALDRSRLALQNEAGIRALRNCYPTPTVAKGRSWH